MNIPLLGLPIGGGSGASQVLGQFVKVRRVDALIDLRMDNPKIDRDAKNLDILRQAARKVMGYPRRRHTSKILPTLYIRYRGIGFPIKKKTGASLPQWRSLTSWMKIQIATLALAERGYVQFRVHLHDELLDELRSSDVDLKDYLRDRIARRLKQAYGDVPWFFFVMEDLATDGVTSTRPHAHGSIELRPAKLPTIKNDQTAVAWRRLVDQHGLAKAELLYSRRITRDALRFASGNGGNRQRIYGGIDQSRNVWTRLPYHPVFNSQWVDYAFKNARLFSPNLGERRIAFSYPLNGEARRLWRLVTEGETSIDQWL